MNPVQMFLWKVCLLVYGAVYVGRWVPEFWRNVLPQLSRPSDFENWGSVLPQPRRHALMQNDSQIYHHSNTIPINN
jgi:hypothetical protein